MVMRHPGDSACTAHHTDEACSGGMTAFKKSRHSGKSYVIPRLRTVYEMLK